LAETVEPHLEPVHRVDGTWPGEDEDRHGCEREPRPNPGSTDNGVEQDRDREVGQHHGHLEGTVGGDPEELGEAEVDRAWDSDPVHAAMRLQDIGEPLAVLLGQERPLVEAEPVVGPEVEQEEEPGGHDRHTAQHRWKQWAKSTQHERSNGQPGRF
jgi:hypothetical protein